MVKKTSKIGRSTSSKSVLFISDMHVGSETAICSPKVSMKGGSFEPNKLQKKLYDLWCWAKDEQIQKPQVLVLNGEPCDGPNAKQLGNESITTSFDEQLDDAEKLLKMYSPTYFALTRGSNYHVNAGSKNVEEILADKLNSIKYRGYHDAKEGVIRTDYYIEFKIHDKIFSATHHIGFNRWFAYRTTALAREMADMEFLSGRYWKRDETPSIVVRSHVHYFVHIRFATQFGFTTPAWKLPDGHLFRGGLGGTAPSIGTVEVIVEPNGKVIVEPHVVDNEHYPKHNIVDLTN